MKEIVRFKDKSRIEKQQRKINESKRWCFKKINKIDKLLAKMTEDSSY